MTQPFCFPSLGLFVPNQAACLVLRAWPLSRFSLLARSQHPAPLLLFPSPLHAQSLTLAAGSVGRSLVPRGAHAQEAARRVLAAPTVTRWRHAVALVHVCGHKQGGRGWGRHSASSPPPDGLVCGGGMWGRQGRSQAGAGARLKREPGAVEGLGVRRFKAAAELQRGGQDLSWEPNLGRGREGNREGDNLGEGKDWGRAGRAALQTQKREGRSGARGELGMGQWYDRAEIRSHGEEVDYSS